MKPVITAKEIDDLLLKGGDVRSLPADAIYTPSALDILRELERKASLGESSRPSGTLTSAPAGKLSSKSSKSDLEALFNSAYGRDLKEQICDVGRRLWQREYVDGNGGNIAIRCGEDIAICTPTLVSKGFMKPDDLCLVDFQGNQILGTKKRTSEILMHLQIMQRLPNAVATCHCHPPYSTAFAVAGLQPPSCLIPEYEVFSSVAIAPYRTPGTPEMGKLVADLVEQHNTVLMANHGVVTWSPSSVEDAYFKMEILEAYCRTVMVTTQLGKAPNTFTPDQMKDLLTIKKSLGIPDPRHGLKEAELCDNEHWRPGISCAVPAAAAAASATDDGDVEATIQAITDRILAALR
jgi:L-fuculose-phosphate aldolase